MRNPVVVSGSVEKIEEIQVVISKLTNQFSKSPVQFTKVKQNPQSNKFEYLLFLLV